MTQSGDIAASEPDRSDAELSHLRSQPFPERNVPFSHDLREPHLLHVKVSRFETYDLKAHLGQMLRFVERGPVGFIYDIRQARVLSYREALLFASVFRDHGERIRSACLGGAVISRCPLQRGVLRTIDWMCPIPFPVRAFGCPREGEMWVRQLVEATRETAKEAPELGT